METLTAAATTAVVPALNEAAAIGAVVEGLLRRGIGRVVVVDGGSRDGTAHIASTAGACVVEQRRRGYGSACIAGANAAVDAPVLLFLDGDGAEDLDGALRVLRTLFDSGADLVLGARTAPPGEEGAQTALARLGNRACSWWLRAAFGAPVTDLPSMKAVPQAVYQRLHPNHERYGWTAQFLARAARQRLKVVEIPVAYSRRAGRSKISGSPRAATQAGLEMIEVLCRETAGAALRASSTGLSRRFQRTAAGTITLWNGERR